MQCNIETVNMYKDSEASQDREARLLVTQADGGPGSY
jgi:hypothetical protein